MSDNTEKLIAQKIRVQEETGSINSDELWNRLETKLDKGIPKKKKQWLWQAAAAILLLAISSGAFLLSRKDETVVSIPAASHAKPLNNIAMTESRIATADNNTPIKKVNTAHKKTRR